MNCSYERMYMKLVVWIILYVPGVQILPAQTVANDTIIVEKKGVIKRFLTYLENSNQTNPDKKLDFSVIGGPYYSSDTQFGLGLVASGLYRLDRNDWEISPSNVSLYGDVTTVGAYKIGISGNTLFPQMKYRIDSDIYFAYTPGRFWGVGYEAGSRDYYSGYTDRTIELKFDFLKKMTDHIYFGITTNIKNVKGKKFQDVTLLCDENPATIAAGVGAILSYDSRDFIPNPYKGVYAKAGFIAYPRFLGSTYRFNRTEAIVRYYHRVWEGGIVAFDLQGIFHNGDVAWNMMAITGNSHQMRGYYHGRYRDRNLIQSQIELRQHVFRRNGVVAWAGAGNVFPEFPEFKWRQTLPTFGVGYRWEFKNRVNVRLDYGIGKGERAFYFNINEAF
ncbi:MAG: outer membrane protein assembly factor [Tannerellaceae bacterium]|nr:outer membrane protein assembly factor [Tannerellaceae bacterium]